MKIFVPKINIDCIILPIPSLPLLIFIKKRSPLRETVKTQMMKKIYPEMKTRIEYCKSNLHYFIILFKL